MKLGDLPTVQLLDHIWQRDQVMDIDAEYTCDIIDCCMDHQCPHEGKICVTDTSALDDCNTLK